MSGRVLIIAEAGVNHNGSLELALRLVDAAAEAGADAVKFQSFKADKVASAQAAKADYQTRTTGAGESQLEMLRRLELTETDHQVIAARCLERGIRFLSTPFDEESADLLHRLGVELFKIPSGEITNTPLLRHVASLGHPLVISTGMADLEEVRECVEVVRRAGATDITLLHCVTEYPAPVDQINLRAMATMRSAFGLPVGYSDHSEGIEIALAATALGACVIEKHFTLDRNLPGPDHKASLEPSELAAMVRGIRVVERALGDGIKRAAPCERANRDVARRSVVVLRDLPSGAVLADSDLGARRPGTGITPSRIPELVGQILSQPVEAGTLLRMEDLQS